MAENSVKLVTLLNIRLRGVQWFQRLYQGVVPFGDSGEIEELQCEIQWLASHMGDYTNSQRLELRLERRRFQSLCGPWLSTVIAKYCH